MPGFKEQLKASSREIEVGRLVALGSPNKTIADILGISIRTVETHRAHLMRKQGLRCAADITRWAIREHLIEPFDDESSRPS